MARVTIDEREIETADGAALVEVIKNAGIYISNLCYIDGRPPYAGCRTCLVEIEGVRGLQLSCTAKATEGMIVRTDTPLVKQARQAVLSLVLSYHSDRCLTCHREVKCKPGDTCLRDNVVTHRCVTCSKNYRCELQTTCEMLEMAGYEPWEGEERTYYQVQQPEPDHGNPFFEFDPQMCIVCTRCVRVCDEIRHTGAITLAGRGFDSRIEFGAGAPIHESNCDFCGSCIDLCPTAALMEHPNKWSAAQTESWVPTTCTQCSVGCSLSLGLKKGRGVIVRPDTSGNPVSHDQLCVRGRFHYDAIKQSERIQQPLLRLNESLHPGNWYEAIRSTAVRLAEIREEHGPDAIGFLGSPLATNEENYLLQKLARAVVGTNNIDSSAGPMARAVATALRNAFGSEILPSDLTQLAQSKTIVVVAEDLESTHNVAALRIKDAVVRENARLIVLSPHRGELCDFADVWLQPHPGEEALLVANLVHSLLVASEEARQRIGEAQNLTGRTSLEPPPAVRAELQQPLSQARDILATAVEQAEARPLSLVFAAPHLGPSAAEATLSLLCNLAIACLGNAAPHSLHVLPQDANVWGMRDCGVSPQVLPGHNPPERIESSWGSTLPSARGLPFEEMMEQCGKQLKALVVLKDNPLLMGADKDAIREALQRLDFLVVIDSILTQTAQLAGVVLPDVGPYGRDGTITSADRRVLRLHAATAPQGEAQPAWRILAQLGQQLVERLHLGVTWNGQTEPSDIMEEIAGLIPLYSDARSKELATGVKQSTKGLISDKVSLQDIDLTSPPPTRGFALISGRGLYASYEGSALGNTTADKLHRDEFLEISPADAQRLGIQPGSQVRVRNDRGAVVFPAKLTDAVAPGTLFAPLYYNGGAASVLFGPDEPFTEVEAELEPGAPTQ